MYIHAHTHIYTYIYTYIHTILRRPKRQESVSSVYFQGTGVQPLAGLTSVRPGQKGGLLGPPPSNPAPRIPRVTVLEGLWRVDFFKKKNYTHSFK